MESASTFFRASVVELMKMLLSATRLSPSTKAVGITYKGVIDEVNAFRDVGCPEVFITVAIIHETKTGHSTLLD